MTGFSLKYTEDRSSTLLTIRLKPDDSIMPGEKLVDVRMDPFEIMMEDTHPAILANTSFSFSPFTPFAVPSHTSGPNPILSRTPGLNGSITTSALLINFFATSAPFSLLRLTAIERFPRHSRSVS